MMPITQASRNVADALTKQAYGKTFTEVDNSLGKTIILLYSQMQMSIEDIAEKIDSLLDGLNYLYFDIDDKKKTIFRIEKVRKSSTYNILVCKESTAIKIGLLN